jgi:peptidoglycan/xylan/chitin deacetylase (PgdA/CDA1 family)
MDEAVLRERRAARIRQVRRRRRAGFASALVVALGLVALLTSGGGGHPAPARRSATTQVAPPAAPPKVVREVAKRPTAMPGAHRAPHEAVPILMYHVIGTRGPSTPNPGLWVAPADFAAHVRALRRAGYHAVTLQAVWDAWHRHGKLPRKPVVVSFDDGYAGQVRDALPALSDVGWPGVLNLELHNLADIGGTKGVKRLIRAGWEVDSHTISHPDLTTLAPDALREEVAGSRARLRRLLGAPVRFFCYPSGRYDAAVVAAVKAAGYLAATTTELGWASPARDPFALPRVRVDGAMSAEAVLQRLRDTSPAA